MNRFATSSHHARSFAAAVVAVFAVGTLGCLRHVLSVPPVSASPPGASPNRGAAVSDAEFSSLDPRLAAAKSALDRQDFAAAFRLTEAAAKRGAEKPAVLEMRAAIFKATDYLDKEIEALKFWTEAAPRDPRPWIKLFYIYLDLGWRQEADRASKQALVLAPSNSRSYVTRAIYYYRSEAPQLAIPSIKEARRLDPSNPNLANLQEVISIKARNFAEAEIDVRKTLALSPKNTAEQMNLYHALVGQNKIQEAEALAREIQLREPGNVETAYELGGLAEKRGDLVEATRQFEKAASLDSRFNNVLWRLGRIYSEQGRTADGRKLLMTFETLEKNTADYETALSRLRTRNESPDLHYQLAKYHIGAGEIPQAIVELRRVLQLRPGDPGARTSLIGALTRQGRVTEARQLDSPRSGPLGYRRK